MSVVNWLRGLLLLRYPELVYDLGSRRLRLKEINAIRSRYPLCKIDSDVQMIGYNPKSIDLGEGVSLNYGTVLAFGDELNGYGNIRIGANTWIGQYNNLRSGGGDIAIGNQCLISQFCSLIASGHGVKRAEPILKQRPPQDRLGITLGNDVWLGCGVTVLPGTKIGDGAVIGAGSVIRNDVPAYEIWAGVPAQRIRERL